MGIAGLAILGWVLRLVQFADQRSIFIDEAALALNLRELSLSDLATGRLAFGQTSPRGYLLSQKLLIEGFGDSELVLRTIPFLAGLASVVVFAMFCRKALPSWAALLALWLFATSRPLVYYSADLKPYSLDVLGCVLLLYLVHTAVPRAMTLRRGVFLGLAGALLVWFSQPVVFVLAGVGLVYLWRFLRSGNWSQLPGLVAMGSAWALSGIPAIAVSRASMTPADHHYMQMFWDAGFPPTPPWGFGDLLWPVQAAASLVVDPLGFSLGPDMIQRGDLQLGSVALILTTVIVVTVAGFGILALRTDRTLLVLLLAPLVVASGAAALRLYPLAGNAPMFTGGRVAMYMLPILVTILGAGLGVLSRRAGRRLHPAAGGLLVLLVLAPAAVPSFARFPHRRFEVKTAIQHMAERLRPNDIIYVHYSAWHSFRYYLPRYDLSKVRVVLGDCHKGRPVGYAEEAAAMAGRGRVWVLAIAQPGDQEVPFLWSTMESLGDLLHSASFHLASARLYDLSRPRHHLLDRSSAPLPTRSGYQDPCGGVWKRNA